MAHRVTLIFTHILSIALFILSSLFFASSMYHIYDFNSRFTPIEANIINAEAVYLKKSTGRGGLVTYNWQPKLTVTYSINMESISYSGNAGHPNFPSKIQFTFEAEVLRFINKLKISPTTIRGFVDKNNYRIFVAAKPTFGTSEVLWLIVLGLSSFLFYVFFRLY